MLLDAAETSCEAEWAVLAACMALIQITDVWQSADLM